MTQVCLELKLLSTRGRQRVRTVVEWRQTSGPVTSAGTLVGAFEVFRSHVWPHALKTSSTRGDDRPTNEMSDCHLWCSNDRTENCLFSEPDHLVQVTKLSWSLLTCACMWDYLAYKIVLNTSLFKNYKWERQVLKSINCWSRLFHCIAIPLLVPERNYANKQIQIQSF